MFDFTSNQYKWCSLCGGNIRLAAHYCRYCRAKCKQPDPQTPTPPVVLRTIDEAALWLPDFIELIHLMPVAFQTRVMLVDEETERRSAEMGLPPMIDKNVRRSSRQVSGEPLRNSVFGLVQDMLLMLHDTQVPLEAIYSDPRMQLLGITAGTIDAEYQLRQQERARGASCIYCDERILEQLVCRFCGNDVITGISDIEDAPPPAVTTSTDGLEVDHDLLAALLLYEKATAAGAGKTRPDYPVSDWLSKLMSLRIQTWLPWQTLALQELDRLAIACLNTGRLDESEIVALHALNRAGESAEFALARANLSDTLARLYAKQDRSELVNRYKEKARAERMSALPLETEKTQRETEACAWIGPFNRFALAGTPEQQLKQLEVYMEQQKSLVQEIAYHMQQALPAPVNFETEAELAVSAAFAGRKLTLEGDIATGAGDLIAAQRKYEEACSALSESWFDKMQRAGVTCKLAQTKDRIGKIEEADSLYKQALTIAGEVAAEQPDMQFSAIGGASYKYAEFLLKHGRLAEAQSEVERSRENFEQHLALQSEKCGADPDSMADILYSVKLLQEKILTAGGHPDEARIVAQECLALKQKAQEWKRQESLRRALMEGL